MSRHYKLYPHQQKVIDDNPDRALICFGAGTGKSLTALHGADKREDILFVCPKAIKQKWFEDIEEFGLQADVMTKEEFKKQDISKYNTMVFDEVHGAGSPIFVGKKRSAITERVYKGMQKNKERNFLGLTATPIASNPWNAHTLMAFTGGYRDWKVYREEFFSFQSPRYMKGRFDGIEKDDGRHKARSLVENHAYIATMEDMADHIPEQHTEVIDIPLTKKEKELIDKEEDNPEHESDIAVGYAQHKLEQTKAKIKKIKELSADHSKVVVFAKYKDQIKDIEKGLKSQRLTLTLTGETKDQGAVIKQAQEESECCLIIQADISEGYELPDFTCMIFASQSGRKISDVQAKARIQRINNLKSNGYYGLISGEKDKHIYKTVEKGEDFIIKKR